MASTFTTNTGIEKIGDGEQSGAWGDTTNLNFDIVDRALNGSVSITLSGTTHTLTTSDGILSDGQYAVLVFTGSPSGTNTVTIAPNTAQKTYLVRNTTAQSVVLTQGSGGSVTVPAGRSAAVYADGGGAAAVVVDISAGLVPALTNAGVTSSTAELNILDGVTSSTAELNFVDGVTSNVQTQLNAKQALNARLTEISGLAVTDGNFVVGNGSAFVAEAPATALLSLGVTSTAAELNILDGLTGVASQAVAEAGTDNATLMTPLRTSQAIAALGGGFAEDTFTASGTWTKPAGVSVNALVEIYCVAGGGGGGKGGPGGPGGGGAGVIRTMKLSELASSVVVTVGAGGTGATVVNGTTGGTTSFGAHVVAYGGGGGDGDNIGGGGGGGELTAGGNAVSGGAGGSIGGGGNTLATGTDAKTIFGGGGGGSSAGESIKSGNAVYGGGGGFIQGLTAGTSLYAGNGGASNGAAGSIPGGGGAGGSSGTNGGAGARGQVRVRVYG